MDVTNQENQTPQKKEKKKKDRTRISFRGRTMPLPYYKKMTIDELVDLIDERSIDVYTKFINDPEKYKHFEAEHENIVSLTESLNEFGYDPEEFEYIKIQEWPSGVRIIDGKKRLLILKLKHKIKNINILQLKDFVKKIPNLNIKRI